MLAAAISGRFENLALMKSIVPCVGRPKSQHIRPSANMFLARSPSRGVMPSMPLTDSSVIVVTATGCTCQSASEPSSSGFAA